MPGRIKGNGIELRMRCDTLAKDITLADTETLQEVKSSLERLLHIVENTLFDLDLLEDRVEQPCFEHMRMKKNELGRIIS